MDQKLQTVLGYAGAFAFVVLSLVAVSYAHTYAGYHDPAGARSFGVTGEGKVTIVPDVGQFQYYVVSQSVGAPSISKLQTENSLKVNKTIAYLEANGVAKKDITTGGFRLTPEYTYTPCSNLSTCPPPVISGYRIQQDVSVKIRDLAKAGDLFAGVVQNGANSTDDITFIIDDLTKARAQAREQAIQDAGEKAQETARIANFTLGRLVYLDDTVVGMPSSYDDSYKSLTNAGMAMATPPRIEAGTQDITVNVTARYEIK